MGLFDILFRRKNTVQISRPIPPPPKSFRFYKDPQSRDSSISPGLKVEVIANSDYHEQTLSALDAIYSCPTGKTVIDKLVNSGHEIKITKAPIANSCDVAPNGMMKHAQELYISKIGPATSLAWKKLQLFVTAKRDYEWLANEINAIPYWELKGVPSLQPYNCGVTSRELSDWFTKGWIVCEGKKKQHIQNTLIAILQPYAENGNGSNAAIGFCSDPRGVMNTTRPAGIGLAHELIHAYWSLQGMQLGWTVDDPTTVLFEYKCVGLGPWRYEEISENQIRNEWYEHTAGLFPMEDHINRSSPGNREYYSKK
jgi:hypothetical protein